MKNVFLAILSLGFLATPASATEMCLTKTVGGKDINPPMCFFVESIYSGGNDDDCEIVYIADEQGKCSSELVPAPFPEKPVGLE